MCTVNNVAGNNAHTHTHIHIQRDRKICMKIAGSLSEWLDQSGESDKRQRERDYEGSP